MTRTFKFRVEEKNQPDSNGKIYPNIEAALLYAIKKQGKKFNLIDIGNDEVICEVHIPTPPPPPRNPNRRKKGQIHTVTTKIIYMPRQTEDAEMQAKQRVELKGIKVFRDENADKVQKMIVTDARKSRSAQQA